MSSKEFREVFDRLVARLPKECASYEVAQAEGGKLHVCIEPANGRAAAIRAIVGGEGVTLLFGRGAVFEVPSKGRRYTDLPCPEEVYALCSAVIAGMFQETVTSVGSRVVGARAKIDLGDSVASSMWREVLFYLPWKRKIESLAYPAYY
jgi:hypothetical protein